MKVGYVARRCASRVDDDDPCPACRLGGGQALIQDRVAPGHVAADLHDQVRFFQIVIASRYHVLAKGAHMAGDG